MVFDRYFFVLSWHFQADLALDGEAIFLVEEEADILAILVADRQAQGRVSTDGDLAERRKRVLLFSKSRQEQRHPARVENVLEEWRDALRRRVRLVRLFQ